MGRVAGGERAVRDLVARCHAGLDQVSLQQELVDRLARVLAVDAVFCAAVDPATLLFTSAVVKEIPPESTQRFLINEFLEEDVNKFTTLAHRRFPVDWLDHATGADRAASPRYREIMAPLGLGDELRAALRSGGECWGFVCLHREDSVRGFDETQARLIARVAAHAGEGLRRALVVGAANASVDDHGPGVLVLAEDRSLVATTAAGERWLWELADPDQRLGPLPLPVETVLARLDAIRRRRGPSDVLPRIRVRTRSGRWAVLHASEMTGLGHGRHIAVVVELATPAELAPMILLAYGLTTREGEVAQLVLQGKPTKQLARQLHISEHTVEDHLKAIFSKVGVGSRGELTAKVFTDHYIH